MNYLWDDQRHLYKSGHAAEFNYSDGVGVEERLLEIVSQAADRSTFSPELAAKIDDWPTEYHLSRLRHCLLRPLKIPAGAKVLELGCGCGAITRYLGEIGADVVAVEGSLARASVAAERCRELPNVRVVADDLLQFETGEQFDYVLLIGVLEYAALFASGDNPFQGYLSAVTRRLAPGGTVVVAIENKLGLKYFNGCSEDHVGIPYFGLQDLYGQKTARTFGRKELIDLLTAAGLTHNYFYYPFPDYKLPSVVLSEAGLREPGFDPLDLIVRSHARDYDGNPYRGFDEALAFAELFKNGMFAEFSNSFLVVATAAPTTVDTPAELASAFSVYRAPQFCVQTNFLSEASVIRVVKSSLTSVASSPIDIRGQLRIDHVIGESEYCHGRQLTWILLKERARSGNLDSFVTALRQWMTFLLSQARTSTTETQESGDKSKLSSYVLPGRLLDCTPFNLMDADGVLSPIDLEWQADKEINLGWVVTRGVLWSLSSGMLMTDEPPWLGELVRSLAASFGLVVSKQEIAAWLRDEADLQAVILGRPCELLSLHRTASGLLPISSEFAKAREALSRQEPELRERRRRVAELERELDRANHTIAQRMAHIGDLEHAIQEQSVRTGILQDRLANANVKLADANVKLSSLSWKLTFPLRRLGRVFPSGATLLRKAAEGAYWLVTFQLPARLRQRKVARLLLESGLFDAQYYLSHNDDVADSGLNPLVHYLTTGFREGRKPNPYFDTAYYVTHNPDVMRAGVNPLLHYLINGYKEGREPGPEFSGNLYYERNSDVRAAGINPLSHFLTIGRNEGRPAVPLPDEAGEGSPSKATANPQPLPPWVRAEQITQASGASRHIIVIDHTIPRPDMDSGSVRMFGLLRLLVQLGFTVTFACHEPEQARDYVTSLEAIGATVVEGYEHIRDHLQMAGARYSTVIISRPEVAAIYLTLLRAYSTEAELFYDSVDLHALRFQRAAEITKDPDALRRASEYAQYEKLAFTFADRVLAVSDTEREAILRDWPAAKVDVVSNIHSVAVSGEPWASRRDLVFIGGFQHDPNVDAVVWFVRTIFPLILAELPQVQFTILGSRPTERVISLASSNVKVVGWVADPAPYFDASRIFVSPLRYGAGMKGKIGQAMSMGLPVVTTHIGAEGMHLINGMQANIADSPAAFARAVIDLYNDEAAWTRMQLNAAQHIGDKFSERAVRSVLECLLKPPRSASLDVLAKVTDEQ